MNIQEKKVEARNCIQQYFRNPEETHKSSVYNLIAVVYGLRPGYLGVNPQRFNSTCLKVLLQYVTIYQPPGKSFFLYFNPHIVDEKAFEEYKQTSNDSSLGKVLGYLTSFEYSKNIKHTTKLIAYRIYFNNYHIYGFIDKSDKHKIEIVHTLEEMAVKWDKTFNELGLSGKTMITYRDLSLPIWSK